jgi:hypothetical protein
VEDEVRAQLPAKQGSSPEQTSALEESIYKISSLLSTVTRNQKYFRTRENRNFSTVRSTESRIVNFSLVQIVMVIAMGGLQVFIVRFFFQVRNNEKTSHPFLGRTFAYDEISGCKKGLRMKHSDSLSSYCRFFEAHMRIRETDNWHVVLYI